MEFLVIGLNQRVCPVEVREKLAPKPEEKEGFSKAFGEACGLSEVVVLSTCGRFEVYGLIPESRIEAVKDWFCRRAGRDLRPMLFIHRARGAVRHLLRVASGLDSWIVGETEILGQVKNAYLAANRCGTASRISHLCFQRALNVGRRVRGETRIVGGIASIGGAASLLARKIFSDLTQKRILVFGAGTMAESTVKHLAAKGVTGVYVANRNLERAQVLAASLGGEAMTLEQGFEKLAEVDIVVVSTGAENYLIDAARAAEVSARRGGRSLFIIDVAVPRNVDPRASEAAGIYLYDIDSLRKVVEDSLGRRSQDLDEADKIVAAESADIWERVAAPQPRGTRVCPVSGKTAPWAEQVAA